jgi:transcriptional regulator with XRE-family HTH domain
MDAQVASANEETAEPIGARLRRLRVERGLSQRELAAPGVSYAYISRIEAGTRRPSVKALRMLARKLGVSPEYLETGSELRDVDERELRLSDAELRLRVGGDPESARETFARLVEESDGAGDLESATRGRIGLGLTYAQMGNHVQAVLLLQDVVEAGGITPVDRPDVYAQLGRSLAAIDANDRAIELLERSLVDIDAIDGDNDSLYVRFAGYLSAALTDVGQVERAEEVLKDALDRAERADDVYTRIRLYWSVARLSEAEGRPLRALKFVRRAIALLEATDDTNHLARAHLLCAWIMGMEERAAEAEPHLEKAAALLGPNADTADLAMLRIEQAKTHAALGRGTDGETAARAALELLGDDMTGERGSAWWALAEALALQNDINGAIDAYARAVSSLDSLSRWREAAQCCRRWAKVLRDAGRDAEALDALERATDYAVRTQPSVHAPLER